MQKVWRWTRGVAAALAAVVAATFAGRTADAQVLNSPSGGVLPAGVTAVGGLVADLIGVNGTRVVSQLSASSLYIGYSYDGTPVAYRGNPLTIGVQSGFTPATIAALGGGLQSAAFRMTLYDGDTGVGDFDDHENFFRVNDVEIGDFSDVATFRTSSTGTILGTSTGFDNEDLLSGFFYTNNVGSLASIFSTLSSTGTLAYSLRDIDPTDNYFDFTQGIDGGLIDVGQGPVVVPPSSSVPEPTSIALVAAGLVVTGWGARRRTTRAE